VIKPYIHDDNAAEIERALKVNALFPNRLARVAARGGARVVQIATDCVYSGAQGRYTEGAPHDALDVYGKSKSLGEPFVTGTHQLRCSIIGPEPKGFVSLLEWFLGRPRNAEVSGFTNHQWNGVTTFHYARLCQGIISAGLSLPRAQHVVPTGTLSKSEMLSSFARVYDRGDIVIKPVEAKTVIDRTLETDNAVVNAQIWKAAGYEKPPTVPQMIEEMGRLNPRWRKA
jgi:dTDP-4-dehydrorhamnose reductase